MVGPEKRLSPDVARSFLEFRFDAATTRRIQQLLQKNNQGKITATERLLLEKYLLVGQLLDLLHARAKVALAGRADNR